MNQATRRELKSIVDEIQDKLVQLQFMAGDEEMKYESLPEAFRDGERGAELLNAQYEIEDACGDIESALGTLRGLL